MSSPIRLDRLLLVCPHPDDETLGAGLLLQEVIARGGQVRVIYLTDGESNPIPQFLDERRWPYGAVAFGFTTRGFKGFSPLVSRVERGVAPPA